MREWFASVMGRDGVRVHRQWSGEMDGALADAVLAFERSVPVTLLSGATMTYEHGRDYVAFFRSIGTSRTFFARDANERVIGTVTAVALPVRMPDGHRRTVAYILHLRVAPDARTGPALTRMIVRLMPFTFRFDRTLVSIVQTGRPLELGRIARSMGMAAPSPTASQRVVTWSTAHADGLGVGAVREATEAEVRDRFAALTRGCVVSVGGDPSARSAREPVWVVARDGSACGCIEDNARELTWRSADGAPLVQSHLSFFGWSDVKRGGAFIRSCLPVANRMGITRLRAMADDRWADALFGAVGVEPIAAVPWTIWVGGRGGFGDAAWVLHPSEI